MARFRKMHKMWIPNDSGGGTWVNHKPKKCYLTVLWGEDPIAAESEPVVYTFNTVEERNAFCKGVHEADGWNGSDWKTHEEPKTFDKTEFYNWNQYQEGE